MAGGPGVPCRIEGAVECRDYGTYAPAPADDAGVAQYALVFPPNAVQIAFFLLAIGILVFLAWKEMRGDHCWRCGIETGLCRHTRYDEPKDPHGGVHL